MGRIRVLDERTVDRIAAGEVVERPASVVKELVENALDAGASAVSIEIRGGGIDSIRVTDNGSGIPAEEVRTAFLPHATSKLQTLDDLMEIRSLGFRGEALPSIASVSQVEILTKPREALTGIRYCIEGGAEKSFEEAGIPDGTTFFVRNLFYHTPARRKFLKTASTEAGYVTSLVEQLAMARPDISFKYAVNGQNRLVTQGNGDLKEVVYRIYGRDIAEALLPLRKEKEGMTLSGYLAKPFVARNSRSMEIYYVNGRTVRDQTIRRALEDGYAGFLMQHRFPFVVLSLEIHPALLDVNIHPRKTEVRFSEGMKVYEFIRSSVAETLSGRELIREASPGTESGKTAAAPPAPARAPEPFQIPARKKEEVFREETGPYFTGETEPFNREEMSRGVPEETGRGVPEETGPYIPKEAAGPYIREETGRFIQEEQPHSFRGAEGAEELPEAGSPRQLNLFEERILSREAVREYRIVGQVFGTYWIIEYRDDLLLIDQHAAHEKVKYERFMRRFREHEVTSQLVSPPRIITLSGEQRSVLEEFMDRFTEMGFEIEPFGGNEYAVRAVPEDLLGLTEGDVLNSLLDGLKEGVNLSDIASIHDRIATMACKAAVKGNTQLSLREAEELIDEMLSLKDPYNCPHGRPTMIRMPKGELEKKFGRVL